jgi:hypothetical protein
MTGKSHTIGTRAQVWHGTAKKTSGGLTKSDLMMNKAGRIVSRSKHFSAKKEMRLLKYGYATKKGQFGFVKVGSRKNRKGSRKMKGGSGMGELSPAGVNAPYMIKDVVAQQFDPTERALVGGNPRGVAKALAMNGGGVYGNGLYPGDVDGQGITNYRAAGSVGVQEAAGMAGGRRRRHRHRRMRGGVGPSMGSDSGSNQNMAMAQMIKNNSSNSSSSSMPMNMNKRGGTTSRNPMGGQGMAVGMGSPLNRALNA